MSKTVKSPWFIEIEHEMIKNGERPFYDWHGETTNLSDQERFEHFKELGFIPQDARIEDWTFNKIEGEPLFIIDPKHEYDKMLKEIGLEEKIINLDKSNIGTINPFELNQNDGEINELMNERESLLKTMLEAMYITDAKAFAKSLRKQADKQKDNLSEEWYKRIISLCDEYAN